MDNQPFFEAKLPIPPTTNQSYETVNFKTKEELWVRRPGSSPALLAFKRDASKELEKQHSKQNWDVINDIRENWEKQVHTHLKITILFHVKYMWKSDADGRIKVTQDAVFKFMNLNDNMVTDIQVKKRLADGKPYCEVTVSIEEGFEYSKEDEKKLARKKKSSVERQLARMRARGRMLAR